MNHPRMHSSPSRLALTAALGAGLALAAGPSPAAFSLGTRVSPPVSIPASAPLGHKVSVPLLPAQYSPSVLDLGTLRAYRNEQHTATLAITAPADGAVYAEVGPQNSPIRMTQISLFAPRTAGGLQTHTSRPLATAGPGGTVQAATGDLILVEVALQSAPNQPETLTAELDAGSRQWYIAVPIKAFVVQQPEIVPAIDNGEVKIVPGGSASVTVHLNRTRTQSFTGPSGVDQEVTIAARRAPAGISVDPVTVRVPADTLTVDAVVPFHATPNTAVGPGQPTTLVVSYGGESQTPGLEANVYPTVTTWHYDQSAGDVHHSGEITLRSDGTWQWKAHLHDSGTVFGDLYSIAFWLPASTAQDEVHNTGSFPFGYTTGQLGGGALGGSQDADLEWSSEKANLDPYYNPSGPSSWLRDHYIEAVDGGYHVWVDQSADYSPAVVGILQQLVKLVGG